MVRSPTSTGPAPVQLGALSLVAMAALLAIGIWTQNTLGTGLLPHAFCISSSQPLLFLHVASDALITAAYMAIPLAMIRFVRQRRDVPFGWVVWFFGAFIVACGLTHAIEIWTLYEPVYWIAGVMKAFTAAVSVATAWILFRLLPVALALPSGADLREANAALRLTQNRLSDTLGELQYTERLLQKVLSTANDAIVVADAQLQPVLVNEAAFAMFRWDAQDAAAGLARLIERMGLPPQDLLNGAPEGMLVEIELAPDDGHGEAVAIEATVSRFVKRGQPMFTIVARDITQRRQAEQELLRSNQRLQQFASVASHDLRSPLRTISGMLGVIRSDLQGQLSALHEDLLRRVDRALIHMNRLTSDLLAYARSEGVPLDMQPVALAPVVIAARELLDESVERAQATLELGPLPTVSGDATQLTDLFVNMLDNALKYRCERPPHIRVSAVQEGAFWRITVADNGIGIPAEHRSRIFEIFERLHRNDQIPGTGIGLAIASRIVQRHGGAISVQPSDSGGAAFSFTLPAA